MINGIKKQYDHRTVWVRIFTIFLGLWLIVAPGTFGYKCIIMTRSDIITGIIIVLFGLADLIRPRVSIKWILFFIGMYLNLAPVLFWAPDAASYLNDTVVGNLLIGLAILVPGAEDMLLPRSQEIPPGWSYNPSSWLQRAPVVVFGVFGWFVARYLGACQLGYIDIHSVWDPFFGTDSTYHVIASDLSKSFPFADGALGAFAYNLEALLGLKGGTARWRTMPWLVVGFGILVIPLGFCSIILVMCQPIIVGYWCGLCLTMAFCMLVMIAFTVDEVVAVIDFLGNCRRKGHSLWTVFWHGHISEDSKTDTRTPHFNAPLNKSLSAVAWGVSIPWNLLLTALAGAWLMLSPDCLHAAGETVQKIGALLGLTSSGGMVLLRPLMAADAAHVLGALFVVISVISWGEVVRPLRFVNILLALILLASLWLIPERSPMHYWNDMIVGIVVILFSFRRGRILERYGHWHCKIF